MDFESGIRHLHGPEEVKYGLDELIVVCLVRDGRPYLKSFVEHYFSLGVKHIIFLDNGSSDGTVSSARSYENVTVLQTELSFKDYKIPLRHYLVTRFGKGRWILYVDIDELFDYPYSDVVSLGALLRYLNEKSYTAVVGQMLDMFPEKPVLSAAAREDEPLKELHRFYDVSNITAEDYYPAGGASNKVASQEIEVYRDGITRTLFGHNNLLTKHPLIFLDDELKPMEGSSVHWVGGARVADITCVLFHYKFIGGFREKALRAVEEESYASNSRKYKRYLETLEKDPELQLKRATAQELRNVDDLVENQFLTVSGDYIAWVEEEERKSGAAGVPEPRRLVEALSRASARARSNARVARNLERQVALLEENLARERQTVELLEKRNRNLEDQIRDIQGSRSWKLLGILDRIRSMMPGKG